MGKSMSEENKKKNKRGQGKGGNYIPWKKIREVSSGSTASSVPDYKNGRMVELISQAEVWWYFKLRWNDDVADIREHFPLDVDETTEIAKTLGIRMYASGRKCMTTDLLLTLRDGSFVAVNVKYDRSQTLNDRDKEKIAIEREYWKRKKIPLYEVYKSDLDPIEIRNLRMVLIYYSKESVFDKYSLVKYLIANKLIEVDMKKSIDYPGLIASLEREVIWEKYNYMLA